MRHAGGDSQGRLIKQKLESFRSALETNYNARVIKTENGKSCKALINKKAVTADYDKETISVEFSAGLQPGDTFCTVDNGEHFIVYLQDLVEIAYFKSEILRCRYTIDINGCEYWVYFKGPTQNSITWNLKSGVDVNDLNMTGSIFIKNDPTTKEYFKRFTKFKIDGHNWQVQATDCISVAGVLEIEIKEYYDNVAEDLPQIKREPQQAIDGGQETIPHLIIGKSEVEPGEVTGYTILETDYDPGTEWAIAEGDACNAEIVEILEDGKVCKVKAAEAKRESSFTLLYGTISYTVHINDAESMIIGDSIVYPYSEHTYTISGVHNGRFYIDSKLAAIRKNDSNKCVVEILSGKKGKFTLSYIEDETDDVFELPITIKSM